VWVLAGHGCGLITCTEAPWPQLSAPPTHTLTPLPSTDTLQVPRPPVRRCFGPVCAAAAAQRGGLRAVGAADAAAHAGHHARSALPRVLVSSVRLPMHPPLPAWAVPRPMLHLAVAPCHALHAAVAASHAAGAGQLPCPSTGGLGGAQGQPRGLLPRCLPNASRTLKPAPASR
jgi:hypothetical protein